MLHTLKKSNIWKLILSLRKSEAFLSVRPGKVLALRKGSINLYKKLCRKCFAYSFISTQIAVVKSRKLKIFYGCLTPLFTRSWETFRHRLKHLMYVCILCTELMKVHRATRRTDRKKVADFLAIPINIKECCEASI